jgi:hypothetical protein
LGVTACRGRGWYYSTTLTQAGEIATS